MRRAGRTVCTGRPRVYLSRIGTNFVESSRDRQSCISSLDHRHREKKSLRTNFNTGKGIEIEEKTEEGGDRTNDPRLSRRSQWDSSGARTKRNISTKCSSWFRCSTDRGWVVGWLGERGRFVASLVKKK